MKKYIFLNFLMSVVIISFYSCHKVIPPQADFSASTTTACQGDIISFTDLSTNSPTSWSWDFGDGGTSLSQNPTHFYDSIGVYSVTLTVTNNDGSDSITKTNYITIVQPTSPPTADFTYTPSSPYAGNIVSFHDISTNYPIAWSWDFGDGSNSTVQNPSHAYISPGTYSVSLLATNSIGSDSVMKNIIININASAIAGTYHVIDTLTGYMNCILSYTAIVTANTDSTFSIYNFSGVGDSYCANCSLHGTTLTIPSQYISSPLPITTYGSGTVSLNAIIRIIYTALYNSGDIDSCKATYTKL